MWVQNDKPNHNIECLNRHRLFNSHQIQIRFYLVSLFPNQTQLETYLRERERERIQPKGSQNVIERVKGTKGKKVQLQKLKVTKATKKKG